MVRDKDRRSEQDRLTRCLPGAAAPVFSLPQLSPAPVDTIFSRAADRTCRLDVFIEVHLVSTPFL